MQIHLEATSCKLYCTICSSYGLNFKDPMKHPGVTQGPHCVCVCEIEGEICEKQNCGE